MTHKTKLRSLSSAWQPAVLILCAGALTACGNSDAPQAKNAAAAKNKQSALMATGVPVATPAEAAKKTDTGDVMKWLQMTGDKNIKPETKAAEARPAPAAAPAAPTAPAPSTNSPSAAALAPSPVAVSAPPVQAHPTMIPVAASAANIVNPQPVPSGSSAAPANPATSAVALANVPAAKPAAPNPKSALEAISRPQPDFPIQARRAGVSAGRVQAQITVGVDGSVTDVKILQSEPRGVFDHAVMYAVSHWKYQPLSAPEATVAEFDFKSE